MVRILRWLQAAAPPLMRTGGLAHGLSVNEIYDRAVILETNPANVFCRPNALLARLKLQRR